MSAPSDAELDALWMMFAVHPWAHVEHGERYVVTSIDIHHVGPDTWVPVVRYVKANGGQACSRTVEDFQRAMRRAKR